MPKKKWEIRLAQKAGGRCYLSRNAYLGNWLKQTGRLVGPGEKPDIVYAQVGIGRIYSGPALHVVQSVSIVNERLAAGWVQSRKGREATRKWCGTANITIAHSDVHKKDICALGEKSSDVLIVRPASGMIDPGPPETRPSVFKIGYAGQNIRRKRLPLAREACRKIGVSLEVAQKVKHSLMADWYRNIGLLLHSSTDESWGLVASEAISCGVPVVCTSGSGSAEEVLETGAGIVVNGRDRDEFINASLALATNGDALKAVTALAIKAKTRKMSDWASELISAVEGAERGTR